MSRASDLFPPAGEALAFHVRLRTLDPTAPADVCQAYMGPLTTWLTACFPHADFHYWQTAAADALFTYLRHPEAYDPARGELGAYLRLAARGDMLNLLRREERHQRGRVSWKVVEKGEEGGNLYGREDEPAVNLEHAEEARAGEEWLRRVTARFSDAERRVLDLMLAGEHRTPVYAAALGLGDLPPAEQEREVKRAKDRIGARLKRKGKRHD